jgi:hypothetical protein
MRKLMAISVASTILGYAAVYFAFFAKPAPQPEPEPAAAPSDQPIVLAAVVDVTDVEPLLDPKPHEPGGVPFDPTEPLEPAAPARAVAPLPRAAD